MWHLVQTICFHWTLVMLKEIQVLNKVHIGLSHSLTESDIPKLYIEDIKRL